MSFHRPFDGEWAGVDDRAGRGVARVFMTGIGAGALLRRLAFGSSDRAPLNQYPGPDTCHPVIPLLAGPGQE